MKPCKKHIGINYHCFRLKITPSDPNKIVVLQINTKEQRSDLFIKGLTRFNVEHKRKFIMDW